MNLEKTLAVRAFIERWKSNALTERSAAQSHFIDLCRLFDHPTPIEDDPTGERFTFEKGLSKTGGGEGFADVWKRGYFAWEYKKRKRNLDEALKQLTQYAAALENPPLHVVCDTIRFRIETRWTNTVVAKHEFELEDLADPEKFRLLRNVFHDPEALRPKQTRQSLTAEAAAKFQTIADRLQHRHPDKEAVAHFVNQLVFCFFANSVKLLPEGLMQKLLRACEIKPHKSQDYFDKLFAQMEQGGEFDLTDIRWFNGGLFDGRRALPLKGEEIGLLIALQSFRWDLIDPTIFGTLFERFLDPEKRRQIGAHYTGTDKIRQIVEPVLVRPLAAEWATCRAEIEKLMAPVTKAEAATGRAADKARAERFDKARAKAEALRDGFVDRLTKLSILDPACGSGNFLYIALQAVKDLEYRAIVECATLGLGPVLPRVNPRILHGIEINPLAAELARTTIWIGDIQWRIANGFEHHPEPILEKLDAIECRDALVERDGEDWREARWPEAEFIVGNPPFLGGKKLRTGLGDDYVNRLFSIYDGRVPAEADLVCYWFEKARTLLVAGKARRAGLVSTNSIRGGKNRAVLDAIARNSAIFEAWGDEDWTIDGAAVRVSLVCFGNRDEGEGLRLDGAAVSAINADLTAASADVTRASDLKSNAKLMFQGVKFGGPFEIPADVAREFLSQPINPNVRPNSDVVRPWANNDCLVESSDFNWCIDFPSGTSDKNACLYELPFKKLKEQYDVENARRTSSIPPQKLLREGEPAKLKAWWIHQRRRDQLQKKITKLERVIGVGEVGKYRTFQFIKKEILPSGSLYVIARDDDTTFGILHSRFHEAWSLRLGTSLEDRPRYTPTTTFETFPFPEGLTPNIPAQDYATDPRAVRIAAAAKRLDDLRNNWLHPLSHGAWQPEIVPTAAPGEAPRKYPDRFVPLDAEKALELKKRTLTNLYNERPAWLAAAHADLDRAVAVAYGWPEDIATDTALEKLLALNLERAAARESDTATSGDKK